MSIRIIVYFITLLSAFTVKGEERPFRTLGPLQGMTQASAISIWQDKWGRMWIGNEVLNCYNGDHVTIYRMSEYFKDIEDADIHGICGNDSVLYLLAQENIVYLDLTTNELIRPGIEARAIYAGANDFYYSSANQLHTFNHQTGLSELVFTLQPSADILSVLSADNEIWLGTTSGLFKLEKSINNTYHAKQIISSESIINMYRDSRRHIWVSCISQKVYMVSPEEQVQLLHFENGNVYTGEVLCFTENPSTGNIWMGTIAGIYLIPANRAQANMVPLLPTSMIYALYTDRQETVWIGSYYGAVRYFNPQTNKYSFWKTDEGRYDKIHGVALGSMAEDKSGNLYIATEGSGINIVNKKTGTIRHLKATAGQLPNDKIRALWFDEEYNRLFIGTYMEGLCYLDLKSGNIRTIRSELLNERLKKIIEKIIPFRDNLILLTQNGIYQMNRATLEVSHLFRKPELQELCMGFIRAIHIDDRNVLWISTLRDGLLTINMAEEKFMRTYEVESNGQGVLPSAIVSICGDSKKGLFFATSKSGLLNYMIKEDSFRLFSAKNNWLLNDICYNLALTSGGNLVVTSNQGVTLLNISTCKTIDSSWHILLNDSYPISEISGDCGLFVSPETDDIYVGGLYGMFSFNEREMHLPNNNYMLYLSSIVVNNEPYRQGNMAEVKKISLPHDKNTLNLTFATSNYMSAYHTRYQYKMEGLDSYWNDTEYKTITYSSLRPGNYRLIIQETMNPDKRNVLDIRIEYPFWLSWVAFLMYAIVLAIFLRTFWVFYKGRVKLQASLEMERREIDRIEEINRNQIDFFTNISNEFRTPLTLITSISYNLLQELSGSRKTKITQIRKQVYFLQNLITELLDFQKVGWNKLNLKVNSFSYPDFIQEMCTSFSIYAQGKTFIFPKHCDETIMLWFDWIQLQKVFYNLFRTAFQLVDSKGKISVQLEKKTGWLETTIVCYTNNPDKTILTRLLKTLNNEENNETDVRLLPGSHIGLVLTGKIIKLHKGTISVTTENGMITISVHLRTGEKHFSDEELSVLTEPAEALHTFQEDASEETTDTNGHVHPLEESPKYRLLVVSHNNEMLKLFTDIFSPAYNLSIAYNGKDGYASATKEDPDLIIAEMSVTELSGIDLCKMIKSNVKTMHIPFILISSTPSEKQQIEAIKAGAEEYIIKPFNAYVLYLRCNLLIKKQLRLLSQFNKQPDNEVSFADMATTRQDRVFLHEATRIIEENFENIDFDTTTWSKQLSIGRTQLFSRIKSITGMTPNDYILSVKMNHAMMLLKQESQITVSEIAYGLGFSNPAYFTRCFKKHTGVPPQQYRQDDNK